jgi:tetratricopeptide (TPR) repeat protein
MIAAQLPLMSDPLRTDGSRAHADVASGVDRDAKIEQLLLVGLDHYFTARYELAINVWTRALFLDRSHARARAYIDRARSALAERQRESEELLQNGVAAFQRGEGDEARRLLQAAIDGGAPSEEALAVLDRLNRLEATAPAAAAQRSDPSHRERVRRASRETSRLVPGLPRSPGLAAVVLAAAIAALGGVAAWNEMIDWRPLVALAKVAVRSEPLTAAPAPVAHDASLPLPRRGETALVRARALTASGHLRDALSALESVRPTDPEQPDADRLRADIQRQLLALIPVPSGEAPNREKGERRNP